MRRPRLDAPPSHGRASPARPTLAPMDGEVVQSLLDELRARSRPARFLHVLGVTHVAVALAARHGVDPSRAAMAALLHDLSRETPPAELEADLARRGRPVEDDDRPVPPSWHGLHAAARAAEFGLAPETGLAEIEEAVRLHTTADAGMGPLARVLYLADSTEPGRVYPQADELRRAARENLDAGFRACVRHKIGYARERGLSIGPRSERAWREHVEEVETRRGPA